MKHFSKVIGIIVLISMLFGCQQEIDSASPTTQTKTHSSERTSSTLIITTPTILSSGTYDLIEIKNGGNLTIPNGGYVSTNQIVFNVNHIYQTFLDIQAGGQFHVTGNPAIYSDTDIKDLVKVFVRGAMSARSISQYGGEFNVYSTGTLTMDHGVQAYGGTFKIDGGGVQIGTSTVTGNYTINSNTTSLIFENCGLLYVKQFNVRPGYPNRVFGKGRIWANDGNAQDYLTQSSQISYYCGYNHWPQFNGSAVNSLYCQ